MQAHSQYRAAVRYRCSSTLLVMMGGDACPLAVQGCGAVPVRLHLTGDGLVMIAPRSMPYLFLQHPNNSPSQPLSLELPT